MYEQGLELLTNVECGQGTVSQWHGLPKVAILLCTFHGQHYLADQLDSFAAQTHSNWEVWASDDGSEDDTHGILELYQGKWDSGRLSIHYGPAEGFVAHFLSLTCKASISADYYAYSDQDDIWNADKLERAVKWLSTVPEHIPALYCSRTQLVDAENNNLGFSPLFTRPPSFANALTQNIAGANTMVFNNAARDLLCKAGEAVPVVIHDWWVYLVVTGCGGQVFYDAFPTLRYRQHDSNIIGMNSGWLARIERMRMLWMGEFRQWNDVNIKALRSLGHRLTLENREILEQFDAARNCRLVSRLMGVRRAGIYRQTLFGNVGLVAAAILKRM